MEKRSRVMLRAVAHDVKNKLAELALCLAETNPGAAALAIDAAGTLTHALMVESDELDPAIDAACPADLLEETALQYRQLFPGKHIDIESKETPALWFYDERLIRLTLSNAVHNALKFCRSTVRLKAAEIDGFLVFEIRDDGTGFPEPLLATGLESGNTEALRSERGTGLGLLLTRRIIQAHRVERGGAIRTGWMTLGNEQGAVIRMGLP